MLSPLGLGEAERQRCDHTAHERHQQHHPPLHVRSDGERQAADRLAEQRRRRAQQQRVGEHRDREPVERWQTRDRQGERAETGQRVQAEEDERADAGGQQAGQQDQADQRAAQARGLQQQEGAEQRRAQQRADRGEAAGRRDHGRRHRRSVARSETHGQDTETASDHDQRSLGAENDSEAQRAERGEQNARQLDRRDRAGCLEAVSRRVTTGARQPADHRCDQQPRQHEQRNRPPIGYGIEAEIVGDALEERLLSDRNELEERERDGGDRHADDGREHEELDVGRAPAAAPGGPARAKGSSRPRSVESRPAQPPSLVAFPPGDWTAALPAWSSVQDR